MRQRGLLRSRALRRGVAVASCAIAAAGLAAGARASGAPVGENASTAALALGAVFALTWLFVWRAARRQTVRSGADGAGLAAPPAPNASAIGLSPGRGLETPPRTGVGFGRLARLQRENRELSAFAATAAHDLQGPLRKIRLHADLLSRGIATDDRRRVDACLKVIQATAERGQALVTRLLELARASDGPLETAPVLIRSVVDEAIDTLREMIEAAGAELRVGRMDGVFVDADPHLFRQVFLNLLENALKYRERGRRLVVEIGVDLAQEQTEGGERQAALYVTDNGEGFSESVADQLFEPFSRFSQSSDVAGSGVGLAIVARVAERHGWRVGAQGAPGRGARFTIQMPVRQSTVSPDRGSDADDARAA